MNNLEVNRKGSQYNVKDSSLMFLVALFLPYIVYFLFVFIVTIISKGTAFYEEVINGVTGKYISSFICQVSLLGTVFFISRRKKEKFLKLNNVNFKLDYIKIIIVVAIGLVALFGFNWLSEMMTYALSLADYKITTNSIYSYGVTNFGLLLVCVLFLAVLPAICEELSIRGVVLGGFSKKSKNFAIFISALMFALMHLSLEQLIYQFVLGVVLASIVYYSGNILYGIILHFVNNALVLVLNYFVHTPLTPQYFFSFGDCFLPVFTAGISVVVIYFLFMLFKNRCAKTGCVNLGEKYKLEQSENNKNEEKTEALKNKQFADLPKPKLEILDEKTALILSLSIGAITYIVTIVSQFLG